MVRRRPFERPRRRSSITCSASTCATSTLSWALTRPAALFTPISRAGGHRPLHDQPVSFSNVKVDGRATYFEWIDAARYVCGNDRGTMTLVASGPLHSVWFGFDAWRLLVRVDTEGGPAHERLAEADRLRIGFVDPAEREIVVMEPASSRPIAYLNHAGRPLANGTTVQVATGTDPRAGPSVCAARPAARAIRSGFTSSYYEADSSLDRAPREGIFELAVPSPDFERIMWQV